MIAPAYNLKKLSGVYCVIHRELLCCYIGSSHNIHVRMLAHEQASRRGSLNRFHRHLRELGTDNFDLSVLQECPIDQLLEREAFWIKFFNSTSLRDLNSRKDTTSYYGRQVSLPTRQRQSFAMKSKPPTPETIEKARQANLGSKRGPRSQETKDKISRSRKGKVVSQETKDKISDSLKGKKLSNATKDKIREALIGRSFSEESIQRMSVAQKSLVRKPRGPRSLEAIKATAAKNKGKKRSPEQCLKMKTAQMKRALKSKIEKGQDLE